jgi:AcrR family transcriptional regulator
MAPRAVNPKKHAARRDEFIDAGQLLITSKGYEQLSIDDVLAATGSSKGAFYHYFDSKSALLTAVVDRMVNAGIEVVAGVVADPELSAIEKLEGYFKTLAAFKGERRDFLVKVIDVWYSDDNAIVRERFRREAVRLVTPHFASIIRQGISEGTFSLTKPEEMARVVLALMMDTGDEAGQMYVQRHAGNISLEEVRQRISTYEAALERLLGVEAGALHLVDQSTLQTWFA